MSLATFAGNRTRRARQFPRWAKFLLAVVVLAVVVTLFANRYLEVYRLNREATRLTAIKRSLQQENAILREEMKLLYTPKYVEKLAREQLGLVRPGEVAVLVVRQPTPPPAVPAGPRHEPLPLHIRIFRALTGLFSR